MLIGAFIERWLVFLLFGIAFLRVKIWDHDKNQYLGFFNRDVYFGFSAMMLGGGILAWMRGEAGVELLVTLTIGGMIMIVIPRIYAEIQHKRHHGVYISSAYRRSQLENADSDEQ
ncbi:MAG: hypothetical protein OXI17_09380 [Gammaproteobacteria bacterium]|nr:hypothetical protein [Gammaproteobacteria bacterium]